MRMVTQTVLFTSPTVPSVTYAQIVETRVESAIKAVCQIRVKGCAVSEYLHGRTHASAYQHAGTRLGVAAISFKFLQPDQLLLQLILLLLYIGELLGN